MSETGEAAVKVKRTCAYCGENRCHCKYRVGRMGAYSVEVSNITEQTTIGQVRKVIADVFASMDDDTPVVFKYSVTQLDAEAIAKAKAKRAAKGTV